MSHEQHVEHLYGDEAGHWVVLSHSDGLTPPPYVEFGAPGPHIPLPGRIHRLLPLGTLRDLGGNWSMIGGQHDAVVWRNRVADLYRQQQAERDSDLIAYLRPLVAEYRSRNVQSVGGWLVCVDEVALRRRFPRATQADVRVALTNIRDGGQ